MLSKKSSKSSTIPVCLSESCLSHDVICVRRYSSKGKQADLRFVDEVKDSVDCAHGRTDVLELKSYKLDADFNVAKEDLRKKILYLEAYSRRENLSLRASQR